MLGLNAPTLAGGLCKSLFFYKIVVFVLVLHQQSFSPHLCFPRHFGVRFPFLFSVVGCSVTGDVCLRQVVFFVIKGIHSCYLLSCGGTGWWGVTHCTHEVWLKVPETLLNGAVLFRP